MEQVYLPFDARLWIQDLLKESGLTQARLAAKIGMGESTLSRYINGQSEKIGVGYVIRMARIFKVSTDFLVGLTDVPDRKNYAIDELGLTPEAARNLYTKKVDPRVASYLLESPKFADTAQRIAFYLEGSLAAGYLAQNVMQERISRMLLVSGRKEAARMIRSISTPAYDRELNNIQSSFMEAVQAMKTDVELENSVEAMSKEQMDRMLKELVKGSETQKPTTTPRRFSTAIVETVDEAKLVRPESLDKLREALEMIAEDLQQADRRAGNDQ